MNKKALCDCCQKKEIEFGSEGVYLGGYQGDKVNNRIHICYDCYNSKEQHYLENYDFIYSYSKKQLEEKGTGYIKTGSARCYANKKGSDGEILRQDFCSHCNPWKFKDEDKNVNSNIDDKSKQNVSDKSTNRWSWILVIIGIVIILALIILQLRRKNNRKK